MDEDDDNFIPPQPRLVRQNAVAPQYTANQLEDDRIWREEEERNSRNIQNVLSDIVSERERNARNPQNVLSELARHPQNRNSGGRITRTRKNRRTRARKNRRTKTRARKNRRTKTRT